MKKISRIAALFIIIAVEISGCGPHDSGQKNNQEKMNENETSLSTEIPSKEAKRTQVLVVGNSKVYLDELRYYFYNTQATYEAYYMAEGRNLQWSSEIEAGITLEEAVKSTVLDAICEREAIVAYADEYKVTFTEKELMKISKKVERFFSDSNENLIKRIDIEKERLKEVFQKDALYKKVKKAMDKKEEGKSEEVYKNWKMVNNVITNEYWTDMNFGTPILMD